MPAPAPPANKPNLSESVKELRERRGKLQTDMRSMLDAHEDFNEEQNTAYDAMETELRSVVEKLGRFDRLAGLQNQVETRAGRGDVDGTDVNSLGVPEKDLAQYSLLKVLRSKTFDEPLDGLERELSDEIARRSNKSPNGVYVPWDIPVERRDLTTSTGSGAIATNVSNTFVDMLRARLLANSLGVMSMSGLVGDFTIPKQTSGATAYWVSEGTAPTKGNQTIGQVSLAPSTVGAYSDMSRKFLRQSSIDAENFVRNDLAKVVAAAIDAAIFSGSGSGAEPEGLLNNGETNVVAMGTNGGAPTWAKVVEMETAIADANADVGSLAYVTTPKARGKMKVTDKGSDTGRYLWGDGNLVNGYRGEVSGLIPSNLTKGSSGATLSAMFFGNWSNVVFGMWGGLDILVDPYSQSNTGTVRVNAHQDVDIAFRHAEGFSVIKDLVTV